MNDFVPTRGARVKKNIHENFVSVQYIAHKKKVVNTDKNQVADLLLPAKSFDLYGRKDNEEDIDPRKKQELEMKRARHDVIKFGMSGLRSVEAHKAKVAAAIALGARPPKKRKMNYKELKEEREKVKAAAKKKQHVSGAEKSLIKRKVRKLRKSQKDSGILGVYGKVQKDRK